MTVSASKKARLTLLMLSGAALLASPAHAGKTDMQTLNVAPAKKSTAAVSADYRELESAGLLTNASEGALGKGLWQGAKRSALIPLLSEMPVASREPVVQRLIFGALLSQTDAGMIDNDIPPQPGRDLLTVRLEKLIQAGAYKQAQDLYSSFGDTEPYHENLSRAGMLAMLLNGEKSLACVEANTVRENFPASEFIKQVLAFCDVTLSEAPNQESREILAGLNLKNADILTRKNEFISYNPESLASLSLIEKAFLAADGRINFEKSGFTKFENIPPTDIRILMNDESLSEKNRFLLTAIAESWGLAIPDELKDVYKGALPPAGGDLSELQVPPNTDNWEKIAYYYAIASNTEDNESRWSAIKNGLRAGNQYEIGALKPYADLLSETQPTDAAVEDMEQAVRIFNMANTPLPQAWIERLLQIPLGPDQSIENQRIFALHVIAKLEQNRGQKQPRIDIKTPEFPYPANSRGGYFYYNIIENVDKPANNSDNANRIYEKDYGLTFMQDYVMPSHVVWNHLLEAGQHGNTGETVLLSASVLQTANLGKIYPDLLNDIRTGLNNVGLTDVSSDIAIAAILGNIQQTN